MKGPVLRIRKGVRVYDDREQEQAPPPREPAPQPGRRARQGGRRGRLTFLPLLVLVLAVVVVLRVVPKTQTNRAVIGGWSTTLRATLFQDDTLLVGVTFVKEGPGAAAAPVENGPRAEAKVVLPDTGQEILLSGILEKSPITLQGQMEYSSKVKKVQAVVSVGAERKTLTLTARARRR